MWYELHLYVGIGKAVVDILVSIYSNSDVNVEIRETLAESGETISRNLIRKNVE
jgi:hypothetical protein